MNCTVYNSLTKTNEEITERNLNWYMCGPTVYDYSHIGHARNYICNDIIRRILEYFGYKVNLVMNITDVDDKIINKSNEIYKDPNKFLEISKKYEEEFLKDLNALNVKDPEIITRASQYINEIIDFINGIMENGYAYESNGSVYFDSQKYYEKFDDNFQLNLNEESFDQVIFNEKKHAHDFVLWKKSKENEPFWDSPWGVGRPGWHIECSAMASDIFGESFDIHSGGCDLKFPHHENELKQANARFNKCCWVKYFIHMGHLHIEGLKMSKSLKNFITIKEILKKYNSNQIKMLFLMNKYNQPMNYSEDRLIQVSEILDSFIILITSFENSNITNFDKFNEEDIAFINIIKETRIDVDNLLKNDFNTPEAINKLYNLVKVINIYVKNEYKITIVRNAIYLIKDYFNIFGISLNTNKSSKESEIMNSFCEFRDDIRNYAFSNKQYDILKLTDKVRDTSMPKLNIVIEDKSKSQSTWRYQSI